VAARAWAGLLLLVWRQAAAPLTAPPPLALPQAAQLLALDTESLVDMDAQPVGPRMQLLQVAVAGAALLTAVLACTVHAAARCAWRAVLGGPATCSQPSACALEQQVDARMHR
jgi:hypothetical protein